MEETRVPRENNQPASCNYNHLGPKDTTLYRNRLTDFPIFASQGLRFGSPFSPPLADLEYILRIHALIFHWLRLPVHVSNQKTFYTEHMLSTKCKQWWHRNALIWQRFATSRFGSNENIFPVCQSFETFTWLTASASKLNLSQISFSSLGAAIFKSPTYV